MTGSYYLQSRYYDPGVKRFFNADSQLNSGLHRNNMFTYCGNNPVNLILVAELTESI
ncbi:MAG: RHS repeat-associated core domain-containing protein [Acutalibacteraceae bacterium]